MFKHATNTKKQGTVGLGVAIAHYSSLGHVVSVPLNDGQDYDLVVDKDGVLFKVQVKTTRFKRGAGYCVLLSMQGGNRKEQYIGKVGTEFSYDLLFVLTEDGAKYEIPRDRVSHLRKGVSLPGRFADCRV